MKDYKYFMQDGVLHRIRIEQDPDPSSPREWDGNIGTMMCWHRNYNLGDYGNNTYSSPEEFLNDLVKEHILDKSIINFVKNKKTSNGLELKYNRNERLWELWGYGYWSLFGEKHEPKFDVIESNEELRWLVDDIVEAMSFEDKWKLLERHAGIVYLPLYLYDHSGITMSTSEFSCKWDSGQVGYIYTDKKTILETVGGFTNEKGNCVKVSAYNWKEAAYINMKSEVKDYDMYLTGEVYGYIVEKQVGDPEWLLEWQRTDSCWGIYSDKCGDALIEEIAREYTSEELFDDEECTKAA